jgi:hypothetical protein
MLHGSNEGGFLKFMILNSMVVAVVVNNAVTKILSFVDPSWFLIVLQNVPETPVTDVHDAFPVNTDSGVGLSVFHFCKNIWIFPLAGSVFTKFSVNNKFSVAPTVDVADVRVNARAAAVGVKVKDPAEISIWVPSLWNVVIVKESVVFANRGLMIELAENKIVTFVVASAKVTLKILVVESRTQLVIAVDDIPDIGVQVFVKLASAEKS